MDKKDLLDSIRQLKLDYNIRQDKRANDMDRKRITVLVTNAFLELPAGELEALLDYRVGGKITDLEKACVVATVLESSLFNKLKNETLRCDPMESEKKLPLIVWNSNEILNTPILDEVITILKEAQDGTAKLEKCLNRERPTRAVGVK